jgi:hypothetical protein
MSTASIVSQNRTEVSLNSFTEWLDYFSLNSYTTAADLEACRATIGTRYPEMVLWLARRDKLRPKVLADAAYTAWLKTENPKKSMCGADWADLFRRAYMPSHELFQLPALN